MENKKKEIEKQLSDLSSNIHYLYYTIEEKDKKLLEIKDKSNKTSVQLEIATKLLANIYQSGFTNISYVLKLIQDWEVDINDIEILDRSIHSFKIFDGTFAVNGDLEELIESVLCKALDNSGIDRSKTIIYKHDVNKFNWWIEIDGRNFGNYRQLMDYLY